MTASTVTRPGRTPATRTVPVAARVDAVVRLGAGLALWAALLLVTYWWDADGGVRALGTWAGALTSIGQLSGLVGSVLLLAQVLLMARVPALELAFGRDRLVRIHRVVGFTSFNLVLLHVLTVTWGYAGGSALRLPGELWDLTWTYPGMLLAVAGTACIVMVVVTSVKAARRRLRYESWHLLHLYAYLGAGLALPHQLWTGEDLTRSTARTVFWWTAWGVAAGAVLLWRVLLPVAVNLRHGLRVTGVVAEGPGVVSVHMTGRGLHRLRVEPGQFFNWRFLGPGWTRSHPYSLSTAPDGHGLRITVAALGDGSSALASLRPGTRVLVEGPYGRLTPRATTGRRIAFLASGVGVTPMRALLEGMPLAPGDAVYVERFRDAPLFAHEVDALAAARGVSVVRLRGPRRSSDSMFPPLTEPIDDATALRRWIPDIAERDVYLCGPEAWSDLARSALAAAGVPGEQIHYEQFGW